jgi:UV DNA damage endonuclease
VNRTLSIGKDSKLGLVCMTVGPEIRFRTMTRTRFRSLTPARRQNQLREIYRANLQTVFLALSYCAENSIGLYRATSDLFPLCDYAAGKLLLQELAPEMANFGPAADRLGVRVVLHPDQYVVLNSRSPAVVRNSLKIMAHHGRVFDGFGLPRSSWSAMILHGGKSGREAELIQTIVSLPEPVRSRLVLENDEFAYGAADILRICRAAGVPMVFDAHHHAVKERLSSYDDPTISFFVREAAGTWPDPQWQIVHLSNGDRSFLDPRHSDTIMQIPSAYRGVPWIEVEAKAKEIAIKKLC